MFGQIGISLVALIALSFFGLISQTAPAQPREPPTASEPTQITGNPVTRSITEIKDRQKALEKQASAITSRQAIATSKGQPEKAVQLQDELTIISQLDATYDQQIAALEQLQSLEAKYEHFRKEIARLQSPASTIQHYSFMELDQAREDLNVELRRKETLASSIGLAAAALEQATQAAQQKKDALAQIEASAAAKENKNTSLSKIAIETARWNADLAEQIQRLHQLELNNQKQAQTVHRGHLELLRRQVESLQAHAVFSPKDLQDQLRRIDKEEFELNRELSQLREQQITVKSRLDRSQKKLAAAGPNDQRRIEVDTEALRLAFEESKTHIDTATRRIELLADWKQVWQRRYAVFNQSVEQATLPQWRNESNLRLTQIDQEEGTVRLWLADWQSRLITLTNKLENGHEATPEEARGLSQQRDYVNAILNHYRDLQTALENSRRLQKKLIDEIDARTSLRSWRDWLDLAIHYKIHENTLLDWAYALVSAMGTFALLYFLRWILIRRLKHLEEPSKASLVNGFLASIKRANSFFFLMLAVSVASLFLTLDPGTDNNITRLTKVAFVFQAAVWGSGFVRVWVFRILARRTKRDGASMGALSIFNFSSQVILWSIALLLILQNLGIDVTALVAGLGIGGVAVALSLQRILNDLFSSLSIVLDKPFVVGDFVVFDDFLGSIEHIGIKTTRIRSLTGEQIICANGDLLNTRIRNFKRMQERRVVFKIGVVYQTPAEKLEHIPGMIREIIENQERTRFDRAHFSAYSDFALLFEIVYYVLSPDYNPYMDVQQTINMEIFKRFQASGIEFAYPTQSLYLQNVSHEPGTAAWGESRGAGVKGVNSPRR